MQKKKTPFTNWKQECLLIPVFAETFPTQDMRANEPCKEGYVKRFATSFNSSGVQEARAVGQKCFKRWKYVLVKAGKYKPEPNKEV